MLKSPVRKNTADDEKESGKVERFCVRWEGRKTETVSAMRWQLGSNPNGEESPCGYLQAAETGCSRSGDKDGLGTSGEQEGSQEAS